MCLSTATHIFEGHAIQLYFINYELSVLFDEGFVGKIDITIVCAVKLLRNRKNLHICRAKLHERPRRLRDTIITPDSSVTAAYANDAQPTGFIFSALSEQSSKNTQP